MRMDGRLLVGSILASILIFSWGYMSFLSQEPIDMASDNEGGRGTSRMYSELEDEGYTLERLLTTPALLLDEGDPKDVLYISLGRGRPFSPTEVQDLTKFHSKGGKVLVAEDGTMASDLSNGFDVDYLDGQLYDERYAGSPDLVQVDVNWRSFSGTIVLNRPTGMAAARGEVVARSGPASWIDRNMNGRRDPENASMGEFPSPKIVALLTDPEFALTDKG